MMNKKEIAYRRILIGCIGFSLCILLSFLYFDTLNRVPSEIKIFGGQEQNLNLFVPVSGELYADSVEAGDFTKSNIPSDSLHINLQKNVVFYSKSNGTYKMECKLFGFIPMKTVQVSVIEDTTLTPGGIPIGIYMKTNGILVIGTGTVKGIDGMDQEPAKYLLSTGDYIESVDGIFINSKSQLIEELNESDGKEVILGIRRNNEELRVKIFPAQTAPEEYKIGIWVRDNTQGIGTLTYINSEGEFGALGHGINDVDTTGLMELYGGNLYNTQILSVVKGTSGSPGELSGVINYNKENILGEITQNTSGGIFGKGNEKLQSEVEKEALPIGLKQDIKIGDAVIRSYIEGEAKDYQIEILKVDYNPQSINKGIIFKVTDKELIQLTGGIVQGMSGSPILQDGKIIGAVTHVFVQDSTKGFGIFIESMLER
ncbi:MAG: SpoIVB peptidase [Lachnospiraceae bacterium]|nr:SpoIVB peptidase [Lachnospiraceae bacterium]